jgi:16S rRNA (guanine1207-N2)-methyltransferase
MRLSLRGVSLTIHTLPGVFSSQGLDDGTRLLLDSLPAPLDKELIADLGGGIGVVGLTLAKLNSRTHIHLLDDHLRSHQLCQQNIIINNAFNAESFLSDLFSAVDERKYHRIISNPPQQLGNEFLEELISECIRHLKDDGKVWFVIKHNIKGVIERICKQQKVTIEQIKSSKEHTVLTLSLKSQDR